MKSWLRDNGLTIALTALFLASFCGHLVAGFSAENQQRQELHQPLLSLLAYVGGGDFLSSVFENWESEFLQMFAYVVLTAYLFQRGSPESKDPDEKAPQDRDPALDKDKPDAPWPVRAGEWAGRLYGHSLGLALLALFVLSFVLHWLNSTRAANDLAQAHGLTPKTAPEHLIDPQFWFESLQNWQSEFLSTAVLIVLAIFLRERGSPESKPVAAPHGQTGAE